MPRRQVIPDAVPASKDALRAYWPKVAERALPYLGNRLLNPVRHVRGETFYHTGPLPPIPRAVRRHSIRKSDGTQGTRVWVDSLDGLLGLVEMDFVEIHPWHATVDDIEHPDLLAFDLDPDEAVDYAFVVETALRLRELLKADGCHAWPKLTGKRDLHVMAPIARTFTHEQARQYCKGVVAKIHATDPSRYTLAAAKEARRGRVYLDYLRNGRGTTTLGVYSPRAVKGMPIAKEVTWKQLEQGIPLDAFTMTQPFKRRTSSAPKGRGSASPG
jgi:bifunctional non-homologous end joining protein LigD